MRSLEVAVVVVVVEAAEEVVERRRRRWWEERERGVAVEKRRWFGFWREMRVKNIRARESSKPMV